MAEFTIRRLRRDELDELEKFGFERQGVLRAHHRRQNGELWDTIVMGRLLP
jgi:RimJ/RimL family protein N-acetyltransferase